MSSFTKPVAVSIVSIVKNKFASLLAIPESTSFPFSSTAFADIVGVGFAVSSDKENCCGRALLVFPAASVYY